MQYTSTAWGWLHGDNLLWFFYCYCLNFSQPFYFFRYIGIKVSYTRKIIFLGSLYVLSGDGDGSLMIIFFWYSVFFMLGCSIFFRFYIGACGQECGEGAWGGAWGNHSHMMSVNFWTWMWKHVDWSSSQRTFLIVHTGCFYVNVTHLFLTILFLVNKKED